MLLCEGPAAPENVMINVERRQVEEEWGEEALGKVEHADHKLVLGHKEEVNLFVVDVEEIHLVHRSDKNAWSTSLL